MSASSTNESPFVSSTLNFQSRRSPVLAIHGVVSSSQTLASQIGLQILQSGGNAADACVAVAAALNVTEPTSTGIGGDCFAIWYDAKTKQVQGLNGSGRSPSGLTLDTISSAERTSGEISPHSVHAVTVPGAAQGWCDTIKQWGKLELKQVLAPAIQLAKEGFPVAPITANSWAKGVSTLLSSSSSSTSELLVNGTRAPHAGEIWKNPNLAHTFELLGEKGRDGFYTGEVAKAIVEVLRASGGKMTEQDLANHISTHPQPISVNYHGVDVYEIPPNGQGITALMALNILSELTKDHPISEMKHNDTEYLHLLIESMRCAFADTRWYVADPDRVHVPIKELLSKEYARQRASQFSRERANIDVKHGSPVNSSSTVSFCCVDGEGNACSFINSNYMGFGTGFIPHGYGFTLQNRGANFSLDPNHPNVLAPNKRPYHTIIPGMATKNGELYCPFSVMGGFMQPQGHVQVLVNMIDFGMDPQAALDQSRFCIESGEAGGHVLVEEGISEKTIEELRKRGHDIRGPITSYARSVFGRGQIIRRMAHGVLWAGSDGRADGAAVGY